MAEAELVLEAEPLRKTVDQVGLMQKLAQRVYPLQGSLRSRLIIFLPLQKFTVAWGLNGAVGLSIRRSCSLRAINTTHDLVHQEAKCNGDTP